jgi:transposase
MSKPEQKLKAIELRRQGFSYREIRRQVPVAKATLSVWLRSVGLSTPQKQRLTEKRLLAARRGAEMMHRQRLNRAAAAMREAEIEAQGWLRTRDVLWLVGTVLYWAEGAKPKPWRGGTKVEFTNTDLRTVLLVREWLKRYCEKGDDNVRYELYIHERADTTSAVEHWAKHLDIPCERIRVRLKKHNPTTRRRNIGAYYYCGTMRLSARRSTFLNHRIAGWILALARHCGVV